MCFGGKGGPHVCGLESPTVRMLLRSVQLSHIPTVVPLAKLYLPQTLIPILSQT